jgi:Family of unknown function (DUF6011)/Large polyvalent protein associated domain 29
MREFPMTTAVEIARAARAALRTAFPGSKISVTSDSSSIYVRWTDEGPTVDALQEVLLAAGCAATKTSWRGDRYLIASSDSGSSYCFDRYNETSRAAERQAFQRQLQEREAENQRVTRVIAQESAAKYAAFRLLPRQELPPIQDPSVLAAFEQLRRRAETEVRAGEDAQRRPSWAPPLVLGGELGEICLELGYLTEDDKWIGRLWAEFATPKRSGKWLRQNLSELPLEGLQCRGFSLWAGGARGTRADLLFEAQREESETWRFGPEERAHGYHSPRGRDWERLVRERESLRHELERHRESLSEGRLHQIETGLADCARRLEILDAEDLAGAKKFHDRQRLQQRARELARARVLEFVGAPDAQMQTAARLWGRCCVCGKALTGPLSLERGIGPDCYALKLDSIRNLASRGHEPESIAAVVGAFLEFIEAVLHEGATP